MTLQSGHICGNPFDAEIQTRIEAKVMKDKKKNDILCEIFRSRDSEGTIIYGERFNLFFGVDFSIVIYFSFFSAVEMLKD